MTEIVASTIVAVQLFLFERLSVAAQHVLPVTEQCVARELLAFQKGGSGSFHIKRAVTQKGVNHAVAHRP